MTNQVYQDAIAHLAKSADSRVVIAVQGGYRSPVFAPKDAHKIKAEGNGLRIGKLFVFACQVKFMRVAPKV